jgi:hypothetical protein
VKHKTFSKENEKKLKLIIKAQKDEIRRLEIEIRELKKELQHSGKPRKPKTPKKDPPIKEVTQPIKQVDRITKPPKSQTPMTAEQRAAFCNDFSKRFKQSRGNDGSESED